MRKNRDRWRYELSLRIGNVSTLSIQHPGHTLFNFLEKQISRYIRGISLSRMEELKVLSINESGDVVFHFFGSGHDKNRVREAGVKTDRTRSSGRHHATAVRTCLPSRACPTT
ncbi:hypothetical protein GE061_017661 [Apolygus lucorum]|uniref:Uncharacterized protein n=1 Tax=Apolygus lucorum TaxID=248454 RepID=A0A8S9XDR5_APOLU|nr:hypothetical protein GE061_017661 [Apolygus lucorum]